VPSAAKNAVRKDAKSVVPDESKKRNIKVEIEIHAQRTTF
jgi:hypothetical protein